MLPKRRTLAVRQLCGNYGIHEPCAHEPASTLHDLQNLSYSKSALNGLMEMSPDWYMYDIMLSSRLVITSRKEVQPHSHFIGSKSLAIRPRLILSSNSDVMPSWSNSTFVKSNFIIKTIANKVYTKYPIKVCIKFQHLWLGYFVYTQPL